MKVKLPMSVKSLQRWIGFVQFSRQYFQRFTGRFVALYKLLQKDVNFELTQVHKYAILDFNVNLATAVKMFLRLPLPDKQLVIMCDASEHAIVYFLLIEDYTETDFGLMESYTPVAFESQRLTEGKMSLTMYSLELLAMHIAFDVFDHIFRVVQKPKYALTDNKAFTRFFPSKRIPPTFLNYCHQGL